MRAKLTNIALAVSLCASAFAPPAPAQEPREPRVYVPRPEVVVTPDIRIAPLPPINVNVDLPDIYVNVPDVVVDGDWINFGDEDLIEREELRQSYPLSPGARVEVSNVGGPVEIETADTTSADVRILAYRPDADKLTVESTSSSLAIRGDKRRDGSRHTVRLRLPRRVNVRIDGAHESVRVGDIDGTITLSNVAGSVGVAQAAGGAEITNVSGSALVRLTRPSGQGVRVAGVSGKVELRFLEDVNADLQTANVRGKVYVELPNVAVQGEMTRTAFRAKVGAGGAPVQISDVTGTVRLSRGASVGELLTQMRADARSATRMQAARELALYTSQAEVRRALAEALLGGQNSAVQMTAARSLTPYAGEPDVRAAFVKVLDSDRTEANSATRLTAVRALARAHANDRGVRELLLRVLAGEKNNAVRMTIVGALAKHTDDPAVLRALTDVLKSDTGDAARARAARALGARVDDAEVYGLLVEAAKNDKRRVVRASALESLIPKIRERAELRQLFVGYLNDESNVLQYQAMKGLVELNDAGLRPRLVEKIREFALTQHRRNWNDRLVLDAVLLLRRLDPQEADRLLDKLAAERGRSF